MRKLMLHRIAVLITAGLAALLLAACDGPGSSASGPATQTPMYVVITDTPDSPSEPPATAVPAGPSEILALPPAFLCKAEVVEQTYENGFMFWVGATTDELCNTEHTFAPGTGEIWVAIFDRRSQVGTWLIFPDTWNEATDPERDPLLTPPADELLQPIRGFGKVWRESLTEEQREALGWATAGEFKFVTDYRYDAGGFLNDAGEFVPRPGTHRLLALGGEQIFWDEQSQTVFFIGPR